MSSTSAPRPPRPGRYYIETWGCQMNIHDSEKLAGALELEGYERASDAAQADVILLNTCAIREKAAEKVFSELGRLRPLKQARPDLVLGLCGCVAQQEGAQVFERAPYVDFVLGPRATGSLAETVARLRAGDPGARHRVDTEQRDDSIRFPFDEIRREGGGAGKAFVTAVEGCNHRCTYCVVPRTRGGEISRDMEVIVEEVRSLVQRGIVEIEFLGQTVNAYRDSRGRILADLLGAATGIEGLRRVRFTTSHPAQMTDTLMDAMQVAQPLVCPYLHLPVQSGSDAVLQRMRRGYDRGRYLAKIEGLRRRIPDISLGTDVIVGFPGESEGDFRDTLTLLAEVEFDTVYSFTYSPRPGTAALSWEGDELPDTLKGTRLGELQELQKTIQERRNRSWIGRRVEVLVEGPSKRNPANWTGRTPEHRVVNFPGPSVAGRLAELRITGSTAYSLLGEPLATFA